MNSLKTLASPYHVDWFHNWQPALAEALDALPEPEDYPLDLYRRLLQSPSPKRIALVRRGDQPVAVVGLRQMGAAWQPLTQWLLPGALFPALPGLHAAALDALPLDLWLAGWRWEAMPLPLKRLRLRQSAPVYCADLTSDLVAYWRSTHLYKTLRSARNHCCGFALENNHPGALEWTVRNWEEHWRADPARPNPDLEDRLLVYRDLQARGKLWVFSLHDCDRIIAGNVVFEHRGELVAGVIHNLPEYRHCKTGHDLIDAAFHWAIESGYKRFDLGGDHDYKHDWAPLGGEKWLLHTSPVYLHYPRAALRRLRGLAGRLRKQVRGSAPEQGRPAAVHE